MKKIISTIMAIALAALPICALADSAATNTTTGEATVIDISQAPALTDIMTANSYTALLARHSSLSIYMMEYNYDGDAATTHESTASFLNDSTGTKVYMSDDSLSLVYDGAHRYLMYPDGSMGVNVTFDNALSDYYNLLVATSGIYAYVDGETVTSCTQSGDEYAITLQITHGAYADATGYNFNLDDNAMLEMTLTLNPQTLDVTSVQLYATLAEGISIPLKTSSIVYDSATLPEQYYQMANASTRELTVITGPKSDNETVEIIDIPEGALAYIIAPDGYAATTLSGDQYIEATPESLGSTGDITVYMIPQN